MAVVGTAVVDFIAETARFNSDIKKAATNLNSEAAKMNRSLASVSSGIKTIVAAGTALAGAAVVGEISRLAQAGLDYASALGEVSQQIGVTTQDLQIYRYAATQVGLSQEEMDKGLQKLTRTLGDAQNGSKSAGAVFAALHVELRNANGGFRTTSEILPDLADAIAKIPDPARRASVEVQLFGKSGQKLDTLLAGGSDAVDQLRNAAQKLGYVLSDEQIQKADETADKLAEIKVVLEARIAGVVADNAGAILELANAFMAVGEAVPKALKEMRGFYRIAQQEGIGKAIWADIKNIDQVESAGTTRGWAIRQTARRNTVQNELDRLTKSGASPDRIAAARWALVAAQGEMDKANRAYEQEILDGKKLSQRSPSSISGDSGLGQFLASGGSKGKKPKTTKPERTWQDDFRDMARDMSIDLGNQMAMMDPLDNSTSKMVDNFLSETAKLQRGSEELAVQMQRDTKVMKTSFADASNGILYSLRDMTDGLRSGDFLSALQGVVNLFLQLGSIGVFGKGIATNINAGKGFASGGYTGSMGTSDVAGVVHGQEYVFDAKAVRRIGVDNLERLRAGAGFKSGGFTGGAASRAMAGLVPTTRVEIVPSALFEAVVDGRAQAVAGPIGVRAAQSGAGLAQETMTRRGRNRIPGR